MVQSGVQEGMRIFQVGFGEVLLIGSRQGGEQQLGDRQTAKGAGGRVKI